MMKLANHDFLQGRGKYVRLRVDACLGEKLFEIIRFVFEATRSARFLDRIARFSGTKPVDNSDFNWEL